MLSDKHILQHAVDWTKRWRASGRVGLTANAIGALLHEPAPRVCRLLMADEDNFWPYMCANLQATVWIPRESAYFGQGLGHNPRNGNPIRTRIECARWALDLASWYDGKVFEYQAISVGREPELEEPQSTADALGVTVPTDEMFDVSCVHCYHGG